MEREHPDRVEDFRVRRIEPGEELRRDEVQAPGVPALKEPGRERPVVPGASRTRSSRCQPQLRRRRRNGRPPRRRSPGQSESRARALRPAGPAGDQGGLFFASSPPAPPDPGDNPPEGRPTVPHPASRRPHSRYGTGSNSAEGAEQLGDPDQESEREHGGRELGRAPAKLGHQPAAQRRRPSQAKPGEQRRSRRPPAGSAPAPSI